MGKITPPDIFQPYTINGNQCLIEEFDQKTWLPQFPIFSQSPVKNISFDLNSKFNMFEKKQFRKLFKGNQKIPRKIKKALKKIITSYKYETTQDGVMFTCFEAKIHTPSDRHSNKWERKAKRLYILSMRRIIDNLNEHILHESNI